MKYKFTLLIVLLVSACAGNKVVHNTPSGKVETTFYNVESNVIGSELVNMMVNRGYTITNNTDYLMIFDKPAENAMAQLFFGSDYDGTPNARVTYTLASSGSTTRVIADFQLVTNPGSAFERKSDFNSSQDTVEFQALLNNLSARLSNR